MSGKLPTFWKDLTSAKKHHQLTVIQHALNDSSLSLGIRAPAVALTVILHIAVTFSSQLKEKDYLITGLNHFVLDHHKATSRKSLRTRSDHYNIITGGTGETVAGTVHMTVLDGVTLPMSLSISQGSLSNTHLVLETFPVPQNGAISDLESFGKTMMDREKELEINLPRDKPLCTHIQ